MSRRSAAIALPARGIGGVAADDHGLAGTECQVIDLSQRKHVRQSTGDRKSESAIVAKERLPVRGDEQDAAVRRPAAHENVRTQPRHAPRGAAFRWHQIDFRVLLVAADVSDPLAVGRQHRRRRLSQTRGQAPRGAAAGVHAPEIVVADKHDGPALQRRLT
jgi:hypothetical protein